MNRNVDKMLFWKSNPEWYVGDHMMPGKVKLTDKAPPKAIESFKYWLKHVNK